MKLVTDIGPRIMKYGFIGGQNFFVELEDQLGKSGETTWIPRGGHRIWVAPEVLSITYACDNSQVDVILKDNDKIEAIQPIEPETGLQKSLEIKIYPT